MSGLGYEPGLFLACPTTTTCYANLQQGVPGTYSEIEVTHDGGDTWQPSNLPVTLTGATRLACVDVDTCATLGTDAAGNAIFLETSDGGATWTSVAGPGQLTSSTGDTVLACTSAESCVALASDPAGQTGAALAFVTDDGGATWTDSNLPSDFVPGAIQCVSTATWRSSLIRLLGRPAPATEERPPNRGESAHSTATMPECCSGRHCCASGSSGPTPTWPADGARRIT